MTTEATKISVVVPIYNVEGYLERCVRSLAAQTFTEYEVLLIDDGSTDSSGALADRLAQDKPNFTVFHKPNGGLSDARNYGLARARGEYVLFVDSDDYITETALEELYGRTGYGSIDMVIGACRTLSPSAAMERFERIAAQSTDAERVYTGKEYLTACLTGGALRVEAWRSLYRVEFLRQNELEFMKGIAHEDEQFTPRALLAAERVAISPHAFYAYDNTRVGSIMNSAAMSPKKARDKLKIYEEHLVRFAAVKPRRLRRLLEDDISWKYIDCCIGCDTAALEGVSLRRWSLLRLPVKPKRIAKTVLYAVSPKLFKKLTKK